MGISYPRNFREGSGSQAWIPWKGFPCEPNTSLGDCPSEASRMLLRGFPCPQCQLSLQNHRTKRLKIRYLYTKVNFFHRQGILRATKRLFSFRQAENSWPLRNSWSSGGSLNIREGNLLFINVPCADFMLVCNDILGNFYIVQFHRNINT